MGAQNLFNSMRYKQNKSKTCTVLAFSITGSEFSFERGRGGFVSLSL